MDYRLIIGILLILYGLFKIGFSIFELRPDQKEKQTFADTFLIILLLLFGIYSLLHGIGMIIRDTAFGKTINNLNVFAIVYTIFGIAMIELYILIVYTKLPIPKDENKMTKYKLVGIGGGILFLIILLLKLLWYKFTNKEIDGYWNFNIYIILYWFIFLTVIFTIIFIKSYRDIDEKTDITSLIAITLNTY